MIALRFHFIFNFIPLMDLKCTLAYGMNNTIFKVKKNTYIYTNMQMYFLNVSGMIHKKTRDFSRNRNIKTEIRRQ